MLLLFLAAAAASAHPPSHRIAPMGIDNMHVVDPRGSSANCPPISRYEAARRGGKLPPLSLNELPMADVYNAVYRRVGGCVVPVIVRYGLGRR